ncbi:MAG: hypothetical protein ABWY58_09010, partial [Aeromicrobium sp.]
ALLESRRIGRLEHRLSEQWDATRSGARPATAHIVDRDVHLVEHGGVSSFAVTVETDDGRRVSARWHRSSPMNAGRELLQPQVPGVGATVRIWAVPGASVDAPHVIEALDPTAVPSRERTD